LEGKGGPDRRVSNTALCPRSGAAYDWGMTKTLRIPPGRPPLLVMLIWLALALEFGAALWNRQWPLAFLAVLTIVLTLLPLMLIRRASIRLPPSFTVGITFFIFATIFLGEAADFYNRYWWWDLAMHGGSALGFGLAGFLFAFLMFEDEEYRAPPWALSFIGFTIAMSIGALWEIFEWTVDLTFGTRMQKSGLTDTMGDLVVNMIGGGFGALCGYLYLKGVGIFGLARVLGRFLHENRRFRRRHPKR